MAHEGLTAGLAKALEAVRRGEPVDVDMFVTTALPDLFAALEGKNDVSVRQVVEILHPARAELLSPLVEESRGSELLGAITAIYSMAQFAGERFEGTAMINSKTVAGRMLTLIVKESGLTNSEIMRRLGQGETSISHAGRRLSALGLAYAVRIGRENHWEATLRGRKDVQRAGSEVEVSDPRPEPRLEVRKPGGTRLRKNRPTVVPLNGKQLTHRESAVMRLVADQLSVGEIADRLGAPAHEVNRHVKSIARKKSLDPRNLDAIREWGRANGFGTRVRRRSSL